MDVDLRQKFVTICARRGAGKSELCRYLFECMKHLFNGAFVISPTDFSGFWATVVGKDRVRGDYNEDWIKALMTKMAKKNEGKDKKSKDFKNVLLILDDVFSEVRGHELKTLTKLCQAGRHYGVAVVCVAQFFHNINPSQRLNTDMLFFGRSNKRSYELLEDEFNQGLDKEEFMDMAERCTQDHGFLLINNQASSTGDLNKVYGQVRVPQELISGC